MRPLQDALDALNQGHPVLLYDADGREEETDMVVLSQHATPETVARMRVDAGGLLCTAIAPEHHEALGLPFLTDIIQEAAHRHPVVRGLLPNDIQYDGTKPAFGLTLNHRDTFTGITDEDRSRTIQALAAFMAGLDADGGDASQDRHSPGDGPGGDMPALAFGRRFRSPGHVILLNGAPGGLAARQGHTELSLELARQAGATPCTTVCEMLDASTGRALSRADAQAYAEAHGLVFLTGDAVVDAWQESAQTPSMTSVPTSA